MLDSDEIYGRSGHRRIEMVGGDDVRHAGVRGRSVRRAAWLTRAIVAAWCQIPESPGRRVAGGSHMYEGVVDERRAVDLQEPGAAPLK